ncbi:hypothetical protein PAXRUDRAFT_830292, partial [Paxillus rubicundulus Ve08.2h10]
MSVTNVVLIVFLAPPQYADITTVPNGNAYHARDLDATPPPQNSINLNKHTSLTDSQKNSHRSRP